MLCASLHCALNPNDGDSNQSQVGRNQVLLLRHKLPQLR